jgi:hypothetical protein
VAAQDLGQQRAIAPTDVNDRSEIGEVVRIGHAGRVRGGTLGHLRRSTIAAASGVSPTKSNRSPPNSISRPGVPVLSVSRLWANGRTPPSASKNTAQERIPTSAPVHSRSPTTVRLKR